MLLKLLGSEHVAVKIFAPESLIFLVADSAKPGEQGDVSALIVNDTDLTLLAHLSVTVPTDAEKGGEAIQFDPQKSRQYTLATFSGKEND